VLVVRSVAPDQFGEPDLDLLRFVAYWVALVAQQRTATNDGRDWSDSAVARFEQRGNGVPHGT
jgi:hypothetical protein